MSGTAPYYTQAFSPLPDPLPGAARLAGPFRTPNGRRYRVEAREPPAQVTTAPG